MPLDGYTEMFERMLDHPLIEVRVGVDYRDVRDEVDRDHLIYTGPIDEYFDYRFGKLPYRSSEIRPSDDRGGAIPAGRDGQLSVEDMPFTRISEYKHLTGQQAPVTRITYEYPSAEGDPYYPIPRPENQELFKRYEALADETEGVTFVGRLATYRYYNMDQIVGQALATFRRIDEEADSSRRGGRRRPLLGRAESTARERQRADSSGAAAGTYVNPILDADFPDPAVILAPDGFYYAYATQTLRDGEWINIQVARSADLVHWQHLGDALPDKPNWARETQDFWAPFVLYDGERYLMYYSATHDACHDPERGHCLAIATSDSPAGPFVDMGLPLLLGDGVRIYRPDGVRRPGRPASACSIGGPASSRSRSRNWPRTGCHSLRAARRST